MSRQVRHRVTALVLGGLLLGTPLLTNGTASAEQVEGGRQVVFGGGGVLGLSCRSTPDVGAMTVPAESTVRVVNRTGHAAQLRLGGTAKGTVPDDGATEVVFRRGTTAVLLSPKCALGDESTPVLVTATPSAPSTAMPNPIPAPSDDDSAGPSTPTVPGSPSSSAGGGTRLPDTATPPNRPQRPQAGRPGAPRSHAQRPSGPAASTAEQAMPQGGSGTRIKTGTSRGTVAAPPTFAGMPPGDAQAIVTGVPMVDLPATAAPAPAAPAAPSTDVAAAERVAATEPMAPNGRLGLLALIALICVAGVSVGTIRAFVSQRASRASMA
jgi:hypothetical protein